MPTGRRRVYRHWMCGEPSLRQFPILFSYEKLSGAMNLKMDGYNQLVQ